MVMEQADIDKIYKKVDAEGKKRPELYLEDSTTIALKKQLSESLSVSTAWAQHQGFTKEFVAVFNSSMMFLQTAPCADPPFPEWMRQQFVSISVEADPWAMGPWATA